MKEEEEEKYARRGPSRQVSILPEARAASPPRRPEGSDLCFLASWERRGERLARAKNKKSTSHWNLEKTMRPRPHTLRGPGYSHTEAQAPFTMEFLPCNETLLSLG